MAEQFFQLPRDDRREVLAIAAQKAERPIHPLEKDTWVVWALLQLTPSGEGRTALEQDYARMLEDGLLLDEAETFDELLARCAKIQDKANASR